MWHLLARLLFVFIPWALVLAGAVALGAPLRQAELLSALGAGLTLLTRGLFFGASEPGTGVRESEGRARRRASV